MNRLPREGWCRKGSLVTGGWLRQDFFFGLAVPAPRISPTFSIKLPAISTWGLLKTAKTGWSELLFSLDRCHSVTLSSAKVAQKDECNADDGTFTLLVSIELFQEQTKANCIPPNPLLFLQVQQSN